MYRVYVNYSCNESIVMNFFYEVSHMCLWNFKIFPSEKSAAINDNNAKQTINSHIITIATKAWRKRI